MEPSSPYRPRVSRETRLLLITGVVALAVLWLLARMRFEDRAVTPSPVPAVLSQLGSPPSFDDLASDIAQLQVSLEPALVALDPITSPPPAAESGIVAMRWRDGLGIALLPSSPPEPDWAVSGIRARDPASGIAVVHVAGDAASAPLTHWTPRRPQQPRYFAVADAASERVVMRPVFVAGLTPVSNPLWPGPVWAVPARTDIAPGSFVFTSSAELVGMVVAVGGALVIVPATTLVDEAARLLTGSTAERGTLGIDVQSLTPSLATLTGASTGVVVTWVDRTGQAAGALHVGDVVVSEDGRPLASRQQWDARMARLTTGEAVTLGVRHRGETRDVTLMAAPQAPDPPRRRQLGVTLRAERGVGAEVLDVEPGSAADRAGLAAGDVITLFGDAAAPSPTQITRAFAALSDGARVMVAFTRANVHNVAAVER